MEKMMDEQKSNSSKTNTILEVIWNRKNSARRSKSLPEMKEINIDDSARKIKMLSKFNNFSRDVNVSDCGIRKRAKRSLFQENKNEKVNEPSDPKKLNKKFNETSSRKKFNCSSEALQTSCPRSPPNSLITNQDYLFQKSKLLPDIKDANDNTKEIIKSSTTNNFSIDVNFNDCGIRKHEKKSLFQENKNEKVNESSETKKFNKKCNETSSRKKFNCSSKALQISRPRSPLISSMKNQDTLFQKSSQESKLLPDIKDANDSAREILKSSTSNNLSRDIDFNDRGIRKHVKRSLFQENKIKKVNEPFDSKSSNKKLNETSFKKVSDSSSKILQISCSKSPLISSMRNQDFFFHNSKQQLFKTEAVKTNDITTSRSFCDEPAITSSCGIDKKNQFDSYLRAPASPVIYQKRKYIDSEIINDINFDKLNRNKTWIPQAPKKFIEKSSNVNTHLNQDCAPASPVIYQKRKYIDSEIINDINFDKSNRNRTWIPQAPKKFIEKSSNVNTHLNQVQTKINYLDTEDIIESSETISSPIKHKTKRHKAHSIKKNKKKYCITGNKINELKSFNNNKNDSQLQIIECRQNTKIEKTNNNEFCEEINHESLDLINTENELKSPVIEFKNIQRKSKRLIKKPQSDQNRDVTESFIIDADIKKHHFSSHLVPSCLNSKVLAGTTSEEDLRTVKCSYKSNNLNENKDKSISFKHSSEINVIPGTPENNEAIVDRFSIEYSPETNLNPNVPLIVVDKSPKTPHGKNHVHIQLVQTPPLNVDDKTLPGLFESISSPTQSFIESQLPFKIDPIESPNTVSMYENAFSTETCKKKLNNSPSPNQFNSAKKRKKICKGGLRGQFQDLINRKKSEACIREYEKNLSKNYQPKEGETTLLNIIEVWKEFKTFVLLCYYMKSETEIQKVLVTLENCPKNATSNSIIRIYSPWLTIKSKNTELLLFVGVIHAEVVEFSGSTRPFEPIALFTNMKGLLTSVFQSEVLWECNCSKDTACQCLGELSTFNYLQYMVPYQDLKNSKV